MVRDDHWSATIMSKSTKTVAVSKTILEKISDGPHAPFVFYDAVVAQGLLGGVVTATLSAGRMVPDDGGNVHNIPTIVAYLRTNLAGAQALHDALGQVIAMSQFGMPGEPEGAAN
jgi:hypothetical protein